MKALFRPTTQKGTHSKSGIAFIVEMLVLLVLIAVSLSVLVPLFSSAHEQGTKNSDTVEAIQLASNTAERFSADPQASFEDQISNDLIVHTTVTSEPQSTGVLYSARVAVYNLEAWYVQTDAEPVFFVDTKRYVKAGDA